MPKTKNFRITHLSPFTRNKHSKPVTNEGCIEETLDCPDTLEDFEKTILELFAPAQNKGKRLN